MKYFFIKWRKQFIYSIAAVLILLIVTNPSLKAFKEYYGMPSRLSGDISYSKNRNYFIFSKFSIDESNEPTRMYLGILGNFFKLN